MNCGPSILNFNIQGRSCHAERNEASLRPSRETLRFAQGDNLKNGRYPHTLLAHRERPFAQGDNTVPMLVVKVHNRGPTAPTRDADGTPLAGVPFFVTRLLLDRTQTSSLTLL